MPRPARVHQVEEVLDLRQSWASREGLGAFARRRVGHLCEDPGSRRACSSSGDSGPLAGSRRACSSPGDSGPQTDSRHACSSSGDLLDDPGSRHA